MELGIQHTAFVTGVEISLSLGADHLHMGKRLHARSFAIFMPRAPLATNLINPS